MTISNEPLTLVQFGEDKIVIGPGYADAKPALFIAAKEHGGHVAGGSVATAPLQGEIVLTFPTDSQAAAAYAALRLPTPLKVGSGELDAAGVEAASDLRNLRDRSDRYVFTQWLAGAYGAVPDEQNERLWQAWHQGRAPLLDALAAPVDHPEVVGVPVAYASQGQMDALEDRPDDPGGVYIPLRKTPIGMFQLPLFAALLPSDSPALEAGVAWGDSGPIPGQSFGDEFDAQPQPASPVAAAPSKEPVAWQETPPDIVQAARMAADTVGVTPYSVMRVHVEHAVRYALLVERASPAVAPVASVPTDAQIKHMVDRFLMWRLPENFRPDAGISFKADFNENTAWPMKHKPVGTNLFDAAQADAMVRNMVEGMPSSHHPMKLYFNKDTLKRQIETDGEEGEIGAGYELFAAPVAPVALSKDTSRFNTLSSADDETIRGSRATAKSDTLCSAAKRLIIQAMQLKDFGHTSALGDFWTNARKTALLEECAEKAARAVLALVTPGKALAAAEREAAWRWKDGDDRWQCTADEDRASYAFRVEGYELEPLYLALTAPVDHPEVVGDFQSRVQPWMMACFGAEISGDKVERGDRLLEEVLELLQSNDYDPARVVALRDYVWSRPAGEPFQEVGGVQVTLAAYCLAHGLNMHEAGETELARIWTKVDKIRAKQAAKPVGSALPIALLPSDSPALEAGVAEARRILSDMASMNFGVSGRSNKAINEWFNEKAIAALAALSIPATEDGK
ncbi:hypothetical protein NL532_24345 [Mesorhizobium sp. C120A]|uniref:hypothetical protein n=1 Tax=unclassified Mesorhizobium TaxID=325217 RepID=UPI0003D02C2B|nr:MULTISPECIES: hypothetical protein [unclassified Mesorhizobium]ESZ60514.1 hypothetical protein X728_15305 [Mesorhizobium sp. L103C120A0]WJI43740.1 hypothetical protein NL532_24345 [Mesorhizobium sp. C120A]